MKSTNNKILVRCDIEQKSQIKVGNILLSTANKFETNYREKSPVIAVVISGNDILKDGDIIVTHHNHFYLPSPYHLTYDLFSIPFNHTIFGKFDSEYNLIPVCGNIFGSEINMPSLFELPPEQIKKYKDRILVSSSSLPQYSSGDIIFTKPSAPYIIVYNIDGIEHRIAKVNGEMVIGVEKIIEK